MDFLIGDVQGCCDALDRLLAAIGFSPSRDHLYVLGDLVNRGPKSLPTLERLRGFDAAATCLLGNHDLHLLAVAQGVRPPHRNDTLDAILGGRERDTWIDWLRRRELAVAVDGWLLVHAGVVPQWDRARTLALAAEAQALLRGPDLHGVLQRMYGNEPLQWRDDLAGADRWRFVINVLTRIRFCTDDGRLEFGTKTAPGRAPPGYRAWFDVPGRLTSGQPIAFGHWSALGLIDRPDLLAIDTGCVWGGALTAVRIDGGRREVTQVHCDQAQVPATG
jgi:bis(5'-nucleosyl)-tetraphosphatase (symmetrical)